MDTPHGPWERQGRHVISSNIQELEITTIPDLSYRVFGMFYNIKRNNIILKNFDIIYNNNPSK